MKKISKKYRQGAGLCHKDIAGNCRSVLYLSVILVPLSIHNMLQ